jgi:hypothetical protein
MAAPGLSGIIELHNTIFFYLIVICIAVFWVLFSLIIYFNYNKAPFVYKYMNHGFKAKGFYKINRNYSTWSQTKIIILKKNVFLKGKIIDLPWIETKTIEKSQIVLFNMLKYLKEINSPLYNFLSNHTRIKELTAIQPYPKLFANVLFNKLPFTFFNNS